jgi:hypothetical protein
MGTLTPAAEERAAAVEITDGAPSVSFVAGPGGTPQMSLH